MLRLMDVVANIAKDKVPWDKIIAASAAVIAAIGVATPKIAGAFKNNDKKTQSESTSSQTTTEDILTEQAQIIHNMAENIELLINAGIKTSLRLNVMIIFSTIMFTFLILEIVFNIL